MISLNIIQKFICLTEPITYHRHIGCNKKLFISLLKKMSDKHLYIHDHEINVISSADLQHQHTWSRFFRRQQYRTCGIRTDTEHTVGVIIIPCFLLFRYYAVFLAFADNNNGTGTRQRTGAFYFPAKWQPKFSVVTVQEKKIMKDSFCVLSRDCILF